MVVLGKLLILVTRGHVELDRMELGLEGMDILAEAAVLVICQVVLALPAAVLSSHHTLTGLSLPVTHASLRVWLGCVSMLVEAAHIDLRISDRAQ